MFARYSPHDEVAPPAVPRRVRRRRAAPGHGRGARMVREAPRRALRARVRRVRRRLGGAARRRAPRVRAVLPAAGEGARVGAARRLPRAVDAVHALRRQARRSVARDRAARARATRRSPTRYAGVPRRRVRDVRRGCTSASSPGSRSGSRSSPDDTDFVYRQTILAKTCDTLRMLLPAGDALEPRDLRDGAVLRAAADAAGAAPARRDARLRRADAGRAPRGDPGVHEAGGPARAGHRLERLTGRRCASGPTSSPPKLVGDVDPEARGGQLSRP